LGCPVREAHEVEHAVRMLGETDTMPPERATHETYHFHLSALTTVARSPTVMLDNEDDNLLSGDTIDH
jgi:hypothetical protein